MKVAKGVASLLEAKRFDEAKVLVKKRLQQSEVDAYDYYAMGVILAYEKNLQVALQYALQGLDRDPFELAIYELCSELISVLGMLDLGISRYLSQEKLIDAAAIDPTLKAPLYGKLSVGLGMFGAYKAALNCVNKALAIQPDIVEFCAAKSFLLLSLNRYQAGFTYYDAVYRLIKKGKLFPVATLWQGDSSLADKTILLHAEQGYGDAIMFVRYLSLIQQQAKQVILEVPVALQRLMRTFPGAPPIMIPQDYYQHYDYHCPLMLLPKYFKTTETTIPATIPYLFAKGASSLILNKEMYNIGIVWGGNPEHRNDYNRSCPLQVFEVLFQLPKTQFYSLQMGRQIWDLRFLNNPSQLISVYDKVQDFMDMANIVSALDLVITVDTAIAHLCGALGLTAWVILPYVTEWRWCMDKNKTPWYPSLRLWRQPKPHDWASVIQAMRQALIQFFD